MLKAEFNTMRIVSYVIIIFIIILGLTFATLNAGSVSFHYYLGVQQLSLSLLLAYALGIGIILGALVFLIPLLKLKRECAKLRKQNKNLAQELANLHNLPAKNSL